MRTELNQRVLTGAIGGLALLLIVIFGGWLGIYFLTAVIVLGMVSEFAKIVYVMPDAVEKKYALLCLAWFAVVADFLTRASFELLLVSFFALFIYFLVSAYKYSIPELTTHFKELMYSVFGLLYLVFLPLYLPRIHSYMGGVHWTILFFLIIWAGDTGAYFVGLKWGRRKLYPRISPKKTLEGALGGVAAGWLVAILYKLVLFGGASWAGIVIIPLLVGPFSQIGDLAESFFKRAYEVKDSGRILPGHGGFMDRFDGVVFALPVMYATVRIFS